jgi:uncharacterized repeat protein (TIGR04076 family)
MAINTKNNESANREFSVLFKATLKSFTDKPCPNYKIGDSWIVDGIGTPEGMCPTVYFNAVNAVMYLWKWPECEVFEIQCECADKQTRSTYELRRINPSKGPKVKKESGR